jgi:hypothetical protein
LWLVALFLFTLGCWNHRSQLERADEHYRAGRYEAAVANLDDLEPNLHEFDRSERAHYTFVRGMSHHRLGQRADARHWLARTRETLEAGGTLPETERNELQRVFTEVDWVQPREGAAPNETSAPAVALGTEPLDSAPATTTPRR